MTLNRFRCALYRTNAMASHRPSFASATPFGFFRGRILRGIARGFQSPPVRCRSGTRLVPLLGFDLCRNGGKSGGLYRLTAA